MKSSFLYNLVSLTAAVTCLSVHASESDDQATDLETIEVIGSAVEEAESPQTNFLEGDALRLKQNDTLGKVLESELGLSNASFGPGVGVPVIRGLSGSRVRLLQNGLGSHDASSLSPDHAVAIEPIFAESIKISRGAENIRYGGNAIGGIVEVEDHRIPDQQYEESLSGWLESRYDTNGDGNHSAFRLNIGEDWFAMTLGGFYRDRNDTEIPGQAIDEDFIQQQYGLTDINNAEGSIPNTDSQSSGGFVGASWLGDQAMIGLSVSYLENQYGVPKGSHGLDPNHLDGLEFVLPQIEDISGFEDIFSEDALYPNIRIDMRQPRYDFKTEWYEPFSGLSSIDTMRLLYSRADYQHTESEGGLVYTLFENDTDEGRFEIDHHFGQDFDGNFGIQWIDQDFSALGVETFVPETKKQFWGIYNIQNYSWNDDWSISAGLRYEQTDIDPRANALSLRGSALAPVALPDKMDFDATSGSLSINWNFTPEANATLAFNYAQRSPDIQELLSLGPHLSTRTFDIGNVNLNNETAKRIDFGLDWQSDWLALKINSYYNRMEDYIYQRNTGFFYEVDNEVIRQRCVSEAECVPIYAYDQRDATFIGYEAEVEMYFDDYSLTLFSDYVRGYFNSSEDVPRMPPLRYGIELGFEHSNWNTSLRYTRGEAQTHVGAFETETEGYDLLNAHVDYRLNSKDWGEVWMFAKASNLLDEEIRSSVSFLRNYAPEPGRSFVFGMRLSY